MGKLEINLPKTAFPMKANLPTREPEFLKFWEKINLYKELRNSRKGKEKRRWPCKTASRRTKKTQMKAMEQIVHQEVNQS